MLKIDLNIIDYESETMDIEFTMLANNIFNYIKNINNINNIKYNIIYAPNPIFSYMLNIGEIKINNDSSLICTIIDDSDNEYDLRHCDDFILTYDKQRLREVRLNNLLNNQNDKPIVLEYEIIKREV